MMVETGRFEASHASKHLQQLCKHFSHKLDVQYDEREGVTPLQPGPTREHARTALGTSATVYARQCSGVARLS
jgi:uncharacterized protein